MKYLFCFTLLLLVFGKATHAQDTIVKTDGTRIIAQVQEVGTTEIKYKKFATVQTSPVYDIAKSNVTMIKYHDGTQDVFPPAPAPAPLPAPSSVTYVQPLYTLYTQPDTNSSITGAYIYLGGMASPLNSFDASMINNYWQNLYANESGGYMKMTKGNPMLYSFYMGGTLQFHKRSNWSYEFQFEYTPGQAIMDSANFPDGTHGSLKLSYMLLNDAIQYTRNIDTAGRLQIGGEASLDIGLTFGSESDVFANNTQPNINQDFDDMHLGSHFALVGKYFINKSKTIGLEGRLGYRFMNIPASTADLSGYSNGYSNAINLDGPFASIGLVFRFRSSYSVQVNDAYYYGY